MKFQKPNRRICPGKTLRFEISKLNPFAWIQIDNADYIFNELDGYIVNDNRVNGIFIKYETSIKNEITTSDILPLLDANQSALKLSELLNCPFRLFIWPEDYPKGYDLSEPHITAVDSKGNMKKINITHLAEGIRKLRGYQFSNPKNLLSANSYVECYLANKTRNPWPGDLDGILFDKKNGVFTSLIEFKTHNIDSPTMDEYIGKYSAQDWRRFEVLFKVQDQIEKYQNFKPNLYYIVWGTKNIPNHQMIKIDTLSNGKVEKSELIERPQFGVYSESLFKLIKD